MMQAPIVPPGIEALPPWVQITVTVLVFCLALFVSFRSIIKPGSATPTKDVDVPGVSVMDGEIFRGAVEQLKQNARQQELRDAQVRDLQRELATQTDIMREARDAMQRSCEHLESIEAKIKRELRRQGEIRDYDQRP